MKPNELSIEEARKALRKKEISSVELTRAVLDRIAEVDGRLGAYITVMEKTAMADAEKADSRLGKGDAAPLTGIPISVKDLICVRGIPNTCGSKILANYRPPFDATVTKKLKEAGAVLVGKTNMDEFAMGSSTENSASHVTRNPWNPDRIPGGSSGGSAVAVAADMCLGSLGSDTGGSIRQPASHCGVVGLKPTYGRVSRFGLVAFASSLDQIGPLAGTVSDCAILMNSICGHDPADSTSVPAPVPDYTRALDSGDGLKGLRVGVFTAYRTGSGIDPDVVAAIDRAVDTFRDLGAQCVEIDLPHSRYGVAAYYVIAPSEASSNLARYDGVKYGFRSEASSNDLIGMYKATRTEGFGPEVRRRILIGTYCLSAGYYDAYYKKASQVRTLIARDFEQAFEHCDIILSPTAPTPAFPIGEKIDDPLTMYLQDVFTLSANLAGIPGLSLPCGFSGEGLPIGLQILGKHFDETTLLRAGYQFEQATRFHLAKPDVEGKKEGEIP